jgi:ankyrin repeat protein
LCGVNPNIKNNGGDTPLHLSKDIEITNILLCAGVDSEIKNNNGD